MIRLHYDRQGRYAGRTQGPLTTCLGAVIAFLVTGTCFVFALVWPLCLLHGSWEWTTEGEWIILLICAFLALGRHASRRRPGPR
jgi:hypothetical protein